VEVGLVVSDWLGADDDDASFLDFEEVGVVDEEEVGVVVVVVEVGGACADGGSGPEIIPGIC
jgi:hypothetical protein